MVEQILDAAARVLGASGYAEMTTNRIAEEAEVSVGSLYRYFADKNEIFDELRDRVTVAVMSDLTEAITQAAGSPPYDGVRAVVAALVASLTEHQAVIRALVNEVPMGTQSNVLPEIERGLAQFTRIYAAQQVPDLARAELDARIYLAMGVTLNSCLRIALEKPDDLDADHLIDLVAGMLALGLT
ncbi:MAG TPA: helix-turn-helix domain-containing protein [Marmoricola sp.]|jgi:AcrR family transcriptional regulator|nr:helix-turn-helix domain-containing protein [Marmoricola sp.]